MWGAFGADVAADGTQEAKIIDMCVFSMGNASLFAPWSLFKGLLDRLQGVLVGRVFRETRSLATPRAGHPVG
eukprot:5343523-Pyramimonas_sp.AAC.1